jgi:hypothetical protein
MALAAFVSMCCIAVALGSVVVLFSTSPEGNVLSIVTERRKYIEDNLKTYEKVGLNSWDQEEEKLIIDRAMARVPTEDELM